MEKSNLIISPKTKNYTLRGWRALYDFKHSDKNGNILWEDKAYNALTDEGESAILDIIFRGASAPSSFYFGLLTGASPVPAETTTMSGINEVSNTGEGYARIAVARNSTDFPTLALDSGDYQVSSLTKQFENTDGVTSWDTAEYLMLTDTASGSSGATFWAYVALSTPRTLAPGDKLDVSLNVKLQ